MEHKYLIDSIKEERENFPDSNIAVLYRNNISGLTLIDNFEKAGIPFNIKDKRSYLDHYVIEDVLNILKFSLDTTDVSLYEQIYYKLNAYLRKDYLSHLSYMDSSMTVFDSLLEIPYLKEYQVDRILQLKHSFKRLSSLPLDRAIAVSYTHLDVYKRQFQNLKFITDTSYSSNFPKFVLS